MSLRSKIRKLKQRAKRWQPFVVAPTLGAFSWYEGTHLLRSDSLTSIKVSALIATATWLYALTLSYGAIYVIIGYHPITGKQVTSYVGKTTRSPVDKRIIEHLYGSTYYNVKAKPWADTTVRWFVAHESQWFNGLTLHIAEFINIKLRRPINNDKMNHGNGRRIHISKQNELRRLRDEGVYTDQYWTRALNSRKGSVLNNGV